MKNLIRTFSLSLLASHSFFAQAADDSDRRDIDPSNLVQSRYDHLLPKEKKEVAEKLWQQNTAESNSQAVKLFQGLYDQQGSETRAAAYRLGTALQAGRGITKDLEAAYKYFTFVQDRSSLYCRGLIYADKSFSQYSLELALADLNESLRLGITAATPYIEKINRLLLEETSQKKMIESLSVTLDLSNSKEQKDPITLSPKEKKELAEQLWQKNKSDSDLEAVKLFQELYEQQGSETRAAAYRLGTALQAGRGITKDLEAAYKYFTFVQDRSSLYNRGLIYADQSFSQYSLELALADLNESLKLGIETARSHIQRITLLQEAEKLAAEKLEMQREMQRKEEELRLKLERIQQTTVEQEMQQIASERIVAEKEAKQKEEERLKQLQSESLKLAKLKTPQVGVLTPSQDLTDILEECRLAENAQAIPGILNKYNEKKESLSTEIKHEGFYVAAELAGVGTLKNRAMVTWCEGVEFKRENTSGGIQEQAKEEEDTSFKFPKLKRIQRSTTDIQPQVQEDTTQFVKLKSVQNLTTKTQPQVQEDTTQFVKLRSVKDLTKKTSSQVEEEPAHLVKLKSVQNLTTTQPQVEEEPALLVKLKSVGEREISTKPSKPTLADQHKIVLRPVNVIRGTNQTMEETQNQVNLAQQAVRENIQLIEEKRDPLMLEKLEGLKKSQGEAAFLAQTAKEAYENLAASVLGLREDIKAFINQTWAETQENKTPEEFVMNLEEEVNHSRIRLRSDKAGYAEMSDEETYLTLKKLLAQANQNYNGALIELEIINGAMMELTQ